ncbi:MAG: hypothetical protein AABZ35_01125 [Gemmatimonadota bacterium]
MIACDLIEDHAREAAREYSIAIALGGNRMDVREGLERARAAANGLE